MSLDDLKNNWKQQKGEEVDLPESTQFLQGKHSPIAKLQQNMRNEFVMQFFTIILMGYLPVWYNLELELKLPYYLLFVLLLCLTGYFFTKFYFFYQKLGRVDLSTHESLYSIYYGLKTNIEVYKAFTYMLIPNAVIFAIILRSNYYYGISKRAFSSMDNIMGFSVGTYLIFFVFFMIVVYFLTEWWVRWNYSRYVDSIGKVIEEMRA